MIIAVAVWAGRISPVFDVTQQILVLELGRGGAVARRIEPLPTGQPLSVAARMNQLGVEVLVCGAISGMLEGLLRAYRIRIIPFVTGEVEVVIGALLADRLTQPVFFLPGTRHRCGCGAGLGRIPGKGRRSGRESARKRDKD